MNKEQEDFDQENEEHQEAIDHLRICFASIVPAYKTGFDIYFMNKDLSNMKDYKESLNIWKNMNEETRSIEAEKAKFYNDKAKHLLAKRLQLSCNRIDVGEKLTFMQNRFLKETIKCEGDVKLTVTALEKQYNSSEPWDLKANRIGCLLQNIKAQRLRISNPFTELVLAIIGENIDQITADFSQSLDNRMSIMNYILNNPGIPYTILVITWLQLENWQRIFWSLNCTVLEPLWYPCLNKLCSEVFESKAELMQHMEEHSKVRYFIEKPGANIHLKCEWQFSECCQCVSAFLYEAQYKFHVLNCHVAMLLGCKAKNLEHKKWRPYSWNEPISAAIVADNESNEQERFNFNNLA